jgi:hypothetical protein
MLYLTIFFFDKPMSALLNTLALLSKQRQISVTHHSNPDTSKVVFLRKTPVKLNNLKIFKLKIPFVLI